MKNFLIEFFRPLDNLIFNYLVKMGGIKPFWEAIIGGALSARSASKSRKSAEKSEAKSQAQIDEAFEKIRDPIEIILEAYGPEGLYSEEVMGSILGAESKFMGPMTDLLKDYGQTMAFGEGGLDELSKQTTESILSRMQELGPEFREALEDPRQRALVEDQIERFKTSYEQTEANSAEREAVAKEFDAGLKSSLQQAGVSIDTIKQAEVDSARPFLERVEGFDTSRIRDFDLGALKDFDTSALKDFDTSALKDFDTSRLKDFDTSRLRDFDFSGLENLSFDELRNLPMEQSSAFLGDIRGLTDVERAEAERLTEAARGPLGFESLRRAEQAARSEGGALGRQLDASAVARAALGREEAVMAREDRAAAARARAAQMAGLGGKLGLSQESLRGDLATTAAKLGLTQQQLLSTLGLSATEAAERLRLGALESGLGLDLSATEAATRLGLSATEAATRLGLSATEAASRLGLGAEEAASKIDLSALGLGAELGLSLDKLGLAREELASNQLINLAKLQGTYGAQARQEALQARQEGRAGFRDVFEASSAMSVDPSSIFLGEAAPAFNLYSSILSQTPGTIFTDPGFALNIGSQYDTTQADILLGGAGISASQAAGKYKTAADQFGTALNLFGGIDFSKKD
jgi:hypothetical protein